MQVGRRKHDSAAEPDLKARISEPIVRRLRGFLSSAEAPQRTVRPRRRRPRNSHRYPVEITRRRFPSIRHHTTLFFMFRKLYLIWDFLRVRKKWWLTPIVFFLLLLSLLIVLSEGSAVAPFIYSLF